MALKLGELTAILKADDRAFEKGLDKAEGKFKKFGDKIKSAGTAAGAAAGAALAAGVAGSLELDAARTKLRNQLGDEALARTVGEAAGDAWGQGFGDSAGDAMEAARAAVQAGLVPEDAGEDQIQALTERAIALSDTFDVDVKQAARAAGQMIRTDLAGSGGEALDVIARGMQRSGDLAGDALDTVSEYSTQFRDLGLDGRQAMGLISQGLEAGARDTDKVADALKQFSITAIDGSDSTRQAFESIGLDAEEMAAKIAAGGPQAAEAMDETLDKLRNIEDPVKRDAAAVGLFKTQAEDLGDALFALDPSEAVDALGKTEGAAEDMANELEQSASQQLKSFKNQAKQALADQLVKAIPHIKAVASWLGENKDVVVPLVGVLGGFAAVVGTVVAVTKVWHGILLVVNAAMKAKLAIMAVVRGATLAWTAAQWLLNAALLANPIVLIVAGIVALIAIIVLIATKTTWFQDIWSAAWGWIKDAASATGRFFKETVWEKWILGAFNAIGDWIGSVVGWFQDIPGKIKSAFGNVFSVVTAPFRKAFNSVSGFWNDTVGNLSWSVPSWVPGIGGNSVSAPTLPRLAQGGVVPAVPGGMPVVAGEGGDREAIAPLSELASMIRDAVQSAGGRGGGGEPAELVIRGDGILRGLREQVQIAGGQVQEVLG